MGSCRPVTEKQNASFPFVWNGTAARSELCGLNESFPFQQKGCSTISIYLETMHTLRSLLLLWEETAPALNERQKNVHFKAFFFYFYDFFLPLLTNAEFKM